MSGFQGQVLIVSFQETDVGNIENATARLQKAFQDKDYDTKTYRIPLTDSLANLQAELAWLRTSTGPRIFYYVGHGGQDRHGSFFLAGWVRNA